MAGRTAATVGASRPQPVASAAPALVGRGRRAPRRLVARRGCLACLPRPASAASTPDAALTTSRRAGEQASRRAGERGATDAAARRPTGPRGALCGRWARRRCGVRRAARVPPLCARRVAHKRGGVVQHAYRCALAIRPSILTLLSRSLPPLQIQRFCTHASWWPHQTCRLSTSTRSFRALRANRGNTSQTQSILKIVRL